MKAVTDDLRLIKKYYGEKMMHLCRTLFPTLLEKPGVLFNALSSAFAYSKFLYDDIISNGWKDYFVDYIYNFVPDEKITKKSDKVPKELLESVGYDLYECHTEEEIQSFKEYYAEEEELCTFEGGRLDSAYVFFVVKKNVEDICREDFDEPEREDEYSTSVMSIQFDKSRTDKVSIKSRYNHTVDNPDATYSNDLDRICPGLADAFSSYYPYLEFNSKRLDLAGKFTSYVKANDGKLYRYYLNKNGIYYYCPDNNIVKNGEVTYYDKNKFLIFDSYILAIEEKTIFKHGTAAKNDAFVKSIGKIDTLLIRTTPNRNKVIIINNNIMIVLNHLGQMIEYHNEVLEKLENGFLSDSVSLRILSLPNVVEVGKSILLRNKTLEIIYLPKVKKIGDSFLVSNMAMKTISLPNVTEIGNNFLGDNKIINNVYLPEVRTVGFNFLYNNEELRSLSLPRLEILKGYALTKNCLLEFLDLENVTEIGNKCLNDNTSLDCLYLPNVVKIGDSFLSFNRNVKRAILPKLENVGNNFLSLDKALEEFIAPRLSNFGSCFLASSSNIEKADFRTLMENGKLEYWKKSLSSENMAILRMLANYYGINTNLSTTWENGFAMGHYHANPRFVYENINPGCAVPPRVIEHHTTLPDPSEIIQELFPQEEHVEEQERLTLKKAA